MNRNRNVMVLLAAFLLSSVPMLASDRGMMEAQVEMTFENPFGWAHETARLTPTIYKRFLSAAAGEESRVGGERIRYSSAIPDGAEIAQPEIHQSPRIGMSTNAAPLVVSSPADPRLLEAAAE